MSIWFNPSLAVKDLEAFSHDTMINHIGIEFTEVGENFMKAKMPVDNRTRQVYGILHGGASATLAETIGSVASAMVIDTNKFYCVGVEINANHIRSIKHGYVTGIATPIHLGNSTHVWDIRIVDEREKLICISRLTVFILKREGL
jgi:1,4-dihydroxy-2-naphthoyl-CoA hydrolase